MTRLATVLVLAGPTVITGDPMIFTTIPNRRGLLIGMTCGVLLGLAPYVIFQAREPVGLAARLSVVLGFGGIGALAGGFVGRTGWITVVGAMIGWIILGVLCALAVRHPKGVMYGILPGTLLGGYAGSCLGTLRKSATAPTRKHPLPLPSAGVWDREVDR
jgi:hypothetical protein